MMDPTLLACLPMLAVLVWAAAIDVRSRRIPNLLTFPLMAAGFLQSFLATRTVTPGQSAAGFGVGFGLAFVLFALHARGAGDVKLQAAIGAWVGGPRVFVVFVLAAVVAMVLALAQAWRQGRLRALFRDSTLVAMNAACLGEIGVKEAADTAAGSRAIDKPLPYAVPLLVATVLVLTAKYWTARWAS